MEEIRDQQEKMANEFEREAVHPKALKGWRSFLGMYAGEHAAGTEFMIGPLFLTSGVSAFDLIVGLLLGNLLAVLSWRYLTASIATKYRLTLYYQLEKICGKKLVSIYNVANGVLFCFLAGAMITVSATAVGIPFDMPMPRLNDNLPNGVPWVIIVLVVGGIISLIAARGYQAVSRFANVAAPWMVVVFFACGLVALKGLGISNWGGFWEVWGEGREPFPGQIKYTFWHVVFWSWFCNAAMHIGMSDLTVFRYAKSPKSGWTTAAGMYIGHYMAWIAASLLYALYLQSPEAIEMLARGEAPPVAPGPMTYQAIGFTGILVVLIAGWTTANPTIYRAGLAFQAILPGIHTARATLLAGGIATIAGLFPAFAMKLLGFVATYGFILAPVGAIIVFEHHFAKAAGTIPFLAHEKQLEFNWAAFLAWLISMLIFYGIHIQFGIFLSFLTLPAWLFCGILFLLLSHLYQKRLSRK